MIAIGHYYSQNRRLSRFPSQREANAVFSTALLRVGPISPECISGQMGHYYHIGAGDRHDAQSFPSFFCSNSRKSRQDLDLGELEYGEMYEIKTMRRMDRG